MTALFVVLLLLVIGAIVAVAMGRLGHLPDDANDVRPQESGFDVVPVGYKMSEVDARIADLTARLSAYEPITAAEQG